MGLFDRWKKVSPPLQVKETAPSVIWPLSPFLEFALGAGGGRITASKAMEFYQTNSTVATAVDKIAEKVEQIKPVLEKPDGSIIDEHPVLDFLAIPSPFHTWAEFMGKLSRHYLLTHDGFVNMLGTVTQAPLEMYATKPQVVMVTAAPDYMPGVYVVGAGMAPGSYVRTQEKKAIRFFDGPLKELYHIMGFSSRQDDLYGDSPLEAAALETRQQIQGKYHNLKLLENGGHLSLIVTMKTEEPLDSDEMNAISEKVNDAYSGSGNAGRIAVVGADADIQDMGKSNKDMDYAKLEKMASEAIYLRYGIPLPLVSIEKSSYNNIEQAYVDFYNNTVLPNYSILAAGLTKSLLPRFGIDDGTKLTYDAKSIPILIAEKLKELKERRDIGIETINELRISIGREEVDDGDVLYQPATLVALGEDDDEGSLTADELDAQGVDDD